MVIKLLGTEFTLTTANTAGGNKLVRLVNTLATNSSLVTHKSNSSITIGTITVPPWSEVILEKAGTDTVETAAAGMLAVPVAYKN